MILFIVVSSLFVIGLIAFLIVEARHAARLDEENKELREKHEDGRKDLDIANRPDSNADDILNRMRNGK